MATLYCPTITYNPVTDPFGTKANHYQIERSPGDTFIYVCAFDPNTGFPTPFLNPDTIIVAIAGEYKPDRYCYPGPRAAYAVFFGPGNNLNVNGAPLPELESHSMSLERGELAAAIAALEAVLSILQRGGILPSSKRLRSLIIKTNSEVLVRGITERAYDWTRKDWIGCGKYQVRNWDLWDDLLSLLERIQGYWRIQVSFWWVPVTWNLTAKRDAGMATRIPPAFAARRA